MPHQKSAIELSPPRGDKTSSDKTPDVHTRAMPFTPGRRRAAPIETDFEQAERETAMRIARAEAEAARLRAAILEHDLNSTQASSSRLWSPRKPTHPALSTDSSASRPVAVR